MKKIAVAVMVGLAFGSIGVANADLPSNTLSIGYAQTQLGGFYSGSMPGVNVKYHWEDMGSDFGAIASLSYTKADIKNGWGGSIEQTSVMVGPSYRFNDYVNAYLLLGVANGKVDVPVWDDHQSQSAFSYGAGLQVNPATNWAVDFSYQYARFDSHDEFNPHIDAGTWVIGVGYRF